MQVSDFKLDGILLKKELHSSFDNIVSVNLDTQMGISQEDLFGYIQNAINSSFLDSKQKYYNINSIENIFEYLLNYYVLKFRNSVNSDTELVLLSAIATSLFLSKSSGQSSQLLYLILENSDDLAKYEENIVPFLESNDLRGLIYWAVKNLSTLDYDSPSLNISYEYAPPKITPQWLNKYRQDEEPMEFWFYNSSIGKALFLILYTPKCRYAKCSGCNLPSLSSQKKEVSPSEVYKQVDTVLQNSISAKEKSSIKELILSNNGNLFDIKTMPTLSLLYTINTLIEELPNLKKIIIESRIEYLNEHQLKTINEVLSAHEDRNIQIEIALGFEIFDDEIRNGYYKKGFYKSALEKLMPLFSKYNVSLKFYMMYKAVPNMSTVEAIADINNVSKYAQNLVQTYSVDINIHISPTYVAVGTQLEVEFNDGKYTPPGPKEISMLCDDLCVYSDVSYYISLNDEGLSSTHIEDEYTLFLDLKARVDYFNSFQKWRS